MTCSWRITTQARWPGRDPHYRVIRLQKTRICSGFLRRSVFVPGSFRERSAFVPVLFHFERLIINGRSARSGFVPGPFRFWFTF
jgi:hypothetical protein